MRVLVLGATGFVGSHVVRALLEAGHEVTGFKRSTSSLELLRGLELPWFEGDLRDVDSLRCAIAGQEAVFHCAGTLSLWPQARERLHAVNVIGTRNVARACLEAGARLVATGSAGIYSGSPRLEPANELGSDSSERWRSFHITSMALAETEVLRAVAAGLDARLLHPTLVVGAGDRSFHSSWLLLGIARARFGLVPPGGLNLVPVADVARAHLLALDKAKKGSIYLLGGENLSNRAVFDLVLELLGARKSILAVPRAPFRALGAVSEALANVTGRSKLERLDMNSELAWAATLYWYVDSSHAAAELGWRAGSARKALEEQIEWLRHRGIL